MNHKEANCIWHTSEKSIKSAINLFYLDYLNYCTSTTMKKQKTAAIVDLKIAKIGLQRIFKMYFKCNTVIFKISHELCYFEILSSHIGIGKCR